MLQRMLGPRVTLVTSGAALARQVEHALTTRDLRNPRAGEGEYRFLCTGDVAAFQELGTRFLQMPLGPLEQVRVAAGGRGRSRETPDEATRGCRYERSPQLRPRGRRAAPA